MSRKTWALICSLFSSLSLFHLSTGIEAGKDAINPASSDPVYSYQHSAGVDFSLVSSNDSNSPDAFSPWSYEPVCTAKLGEIGSELCVYTDRFFSNGRGISIFTTPAIAVEFAATLASLAHPPVLDTLGINGFTGAWYTQPVPGKGIGTLAKRDLHRGDTVTAYTPVLLAYKEDILPRAQREKFLQLALAQLPPLSREAYLGLATISDDPSFLAQDIASANAFEMLLEEKKKAFTASSAGASPIAHLAIIPEASRMNHDCAPNAIFHVNASTLAHVVRATRPVRAGEEITIAYTNPLAPRAVRQKYLSAAFHFTCTCARCLRDGTDADSDAVLAEIAALQATLSRWSEDPPTDSGSAADASAHVKNAERLVRLLLDEGLHGYLDPAYCAAALVYSGAGSVRGARKYLALAIEAIELRLGAGAPDLPAWRAMLDDPTRHWSWMVNKRKVGRREGGKEDRGRG